MTTWERLKTQKATMVKLVSAAVSSTRRPTNQRQSVHSTLCSVAYLFCSVCLFAPCFCSKYTCMSCALLPCPTCLYLFFLFTYFRITFSGRLMVTNLRLIWVSDKRTRTNLCKPQCNCQVTTACHQIIPFQSLSSPSRLRRRHTYYSRYYILVPLHPKTYS